MHDVRKTAAIMTLVIAAMAYPLATIGPAGWARALGWGVPGIPPLAWALAFAVAAAYIAVSMRSLPYIRAHVLDLTWLKALAVVFAVVTGTFEELFFRQWLMNAAAAHGASPLLQVLRSGVIFGLAHGVWGLLGGSLVAAAKAVAFTTTLGLALAVTYLVAARHVAPAAWSHLLINLVIEPWLLLAVAELRRRPV